MRSLEAGMRAWLIERMGLRDSPRREAALAIMALAGREPTICRAQILEQLSGRFYWKCLDRAVDALLARRLLEEADGYRLTKGGGRHFRSRYVMGAGGAEVMEEAAAPPSVYDVDQTLEDVDAEWDASFA